MWLLDKALRRVLRRGQLTVTDHKGAVHTYGAPDPEVRPVAVRFTDRRVPTEIARDPGLGAAETYMDGRLILEQGDILDLVTLIRRNNRWEDKSAEKDTFLRKGGKLKNRLDRLNWQRRSRRNVAHHYDIGNQLYELFLDADMQYSCAYFADPANSLEQAQLDKKAHIAAKLALKPGQRVLDIGCGWGGMALFMHKVAGVDVLGVTLSERQLEIARARAAAAGVSDHVKFELRDYRLLDEQFDRIVSVGMFEHVGAKHYDEFFDKCRQLLKPDGVMLLHTIGKLGEVSDGPDPFTDKYIFPGYHLPSLSEMCSASQKVRLIVSDVETLRLHYAYTLEHWLDRANKARGEIEAMYDDRFFRMWEHYLAGGIVMFENGAACNYQVQYVKDRRALPITRDYMSEAETRYRKIGAQPVEPERSRAKRQRAEKPAFAK